MEFHEIEDRCVSMDVYSKKWIVTSCASYKFVICEAVAMNGMAQNPEEKSIVMGRFKRS